MENIFENNKYRIAWFPQEKIMEFYMKDIEIEKEDIIEMHRQALLLARGSKYANVFSAKDFFSITNEARNEGSKPIYSKDLIAQALVVKNLAQRLIGTFIMKFNKPVRETKMFPEFADARIWAAAKVKEYERAKKKEHKALLV